MKIKKQKRFLGILMISSLVLTFSFFSPMRVANAVDSLTDAKDTISDSDNGQTADHIFTFNTTNATPASGRIDVVFPLDFGDVPGGGVTCPANWTASSPDTETARCTADNLRAAGPITINVDGVTNPAATSSKLFNINQYDNNGTLIARVQVRVAIIEDVLMTARVDATLTFLISGLATGQTVNGVTCDNDSTATTTPFGTLAVLTPETVCQELSVKTNADDGYTVTVWEDNEMTSDSGSNINSFNNAPDGTGTVAPGAWAVPTGVLDDTKTYGHMGLTSQDSTLSTGDPFGASLYVGFNDTDQVEVMYHTGPSDGTTEDIGKTRVAYTAEITALQEAGDYQNTLTYICTPQY